MVEPLILSREGIFMLVEQASARKIPIFSDALVKTALAYHDLRDERDGILRVIQATRATIRAEGPACCMNTLRHLVKDIKAAVPNVAGALSLPAAAEEEKP